MVVGQCHVSDSATLRGALPRQLLLEILDSIHIILFPLDEKSSSFKILERLTVGPLGFDPDCLDYTDFSSFRNDEEEIITFAYLDHRLEALAQELSDPKPYGRLYKWLERLGKKERYNMLAVLIGIIIAIILGVLALMVSIVQTWITYMAWKHPVIVSTTAGK